MLNSTIHDVRYNLRKSVDGNFEYTLQ